MVLGQLEYGNKISILSGNYLLITELGDDISAAATSYAGKDTMRDQLKGIKEKIDDADESAKTAVMGEVVSTTVALLGAYPTLRLPYLEEEDE